MPKKQATGGGGGVLFYGMYSLTYGFVWKKVLLFDC